MTHDDTEAPASLAAAAIGGAIRGLRRERRWSIEYLAERANVSYQYLSEIETGKRNFSVDVMERLAAGLQVSLSSLMGVAYASTPDGPLPQAA